MKPIRNTREWKIALISAGTAAVLGIGMTTGAHAFAGSNTTYLSATPAKQVVAVAKRDVRESADSTKRRAAKRPAKALSTFEGKLSVDDGLFKLEVQRIIGKGSSQYSWQLFEHHAVLQLAPGVGIVDGRGMQVAPALADDAIVRVQGRLLARSSWQWSDDGDLRPLIRAQRIVVLRLDHELGD
jgi:hypothetical protein